MFQKFLKTSTIPISYSAFLLFQQTITMQISTKTTWLLSLQKHVPRFFWKKYIHFRTAIKYVVLGPRKSPMPLVRVFSENDKIFRQEKKYVE